MLPQRFCDAHNITDAAVAERVAAALDARGAARSARRLLMAIPLDAPDGRRLSLEA